MLVIESVVVIVVFARGIEVTRLVLVIVLVIVRGVAVTTTVAVEDTVFVEHCGCHA